VRVPNWGARMSQAQTFYEDHYLYEGVTWWFVRELIGQGLRERYQVPKVLPPKLLTLVSKLDDRDWFLPNVSWGDDVDLLGGRVRR
jgi:hypothetical protein